MKKPVAAKKRRASPRKAKAAPAPPDLTAVKEYVDDQLALLKQHGTHLRISDADYNSVINKVASISAFGQRKNQREKLAEETI